MSLVVISIILISTFMHAGWNLIARYSHSERTFYQKMLIVITVVGFIPAVWSEIVTRSMTPLAWVCVIGSGTCASIYLFFLARAYEVSDFTVVYPVVRSLPVIFVAVGDVLRGNYLTITGWIGILFVAAGCILVPQTSFRTLHWRNYINRATIWMILAALGTVGYTLLDKIAAEVVQQGPATAARYGYFYFSISLIPYMVLMHFNKPVQEISSKNEWLRASIATLFGFGAYWLILWAYQLTPYAGYIVAFRQFSIIIGSFIAFLIYHERGIKIRLTGAFFVTMGLILIAVWGG
jgi:drug/metabolite transporter (DMT)-like permease